MEGERRLVRRNSKKQEVETWLSTLLNRRPRSSSAGCIFYGVPKKLYKVNEEAFIPQAISIGPLHHNEEHLQPLQPNKEYYLKCFFERTAADKDDYYKKAKEWEGEARAYYQGKVHLNQDDFVKMLLMDGIFIIEFFLRMRSYKQEDEHDEIFKKHILREDIFIDLILLENQLPLVVLKDLYNSFNHDLKWEEFLFWIAREYFKKGVSFDKAKETLENSDIWHLVDFLHALCVVSIPRKLKQFESKHQPNIELSRSATELRKAGVKFVKAAMGKHPFDFNFTEDGTLEIPNIVLDRWTECFFRNFIAHEHCLHKDKIISSYIILVSSLLKNSKDVKLLVELKIIDNRSLGNNEDVCTLFKSLYNRSMMDKSEFYYSSLCERLNEYRRDSWHQWKAKLYGWVEMLKRDYFSDRWSIISVFAGYVLLILAILQTVCSIIVERWYKAHA